MTLLKRPAGERPSPHPDIQRAATSLYNHALEF
jgi:hypothetical protein